MLCPLLGADLPTEDGRRVHRLCADFVPETRVVSGPKGDVVLGIDDVPNARWKLVSHGGIYTSDQCMYGRRYLQS